MSTKLLFSGIKVLLLLISISTSAQQPTLEWAKRFNGTATNATDKAVAIAVDDAGNSFVTGISNENGTQRIATIKYAPSGQQLWAVHYEGNVTATDIAIDNTGGVYVIGTSNSDYLTIRYNAATGEQAWVQHYDGGGTDEAIDIVVDNADGVYVTGNSSGSFATVRYNAATGAMIWEQRHEGGGTTAGIAVDNEGNVYIAGNSNGDYLTFRYDAATGEQAWVQRYDGFGWIDIASAIAVDNAGGVYVTGSSTGDYYMNFHFATIRYDAATGEQTWVQRIADDMNYTVERAADIAVDNAGSVYVTGSRSIIRGGDVALTIAYATATGEQRWAQSYQGQAIDIDVAAIVVDNAGGVYITGSSLDNTSSYVTIRYNTVTGERAWVQLYGATQYGDYQAMDIAVDHNGGIYVTGFSIGQTATYNYATVRYTGSTGEQSWVQQYDGGAPISASDYTVALAVDAEGNSYVTGTSVAEQSVHITTVKYSPSGEEIWAVQMEDNSEAAAIAVDNGGVYVTGSIAGRMGYYYVTKRYDAETGDETWVSYYYGSGGGGASPVAIAVDDTGGVYVTGSTSSFNHIHTRYATVRYNAATGEETWASTYYSSGSGPSYSTAIAVDGTGGVYVTGTSFENRNGFSDYATVRYEAATGEEAWVQQYNGPGELNDFARAIAVDNAGGVYVTGYTTGSDNDIDYATVRYNATTGAGTWTRLYDGPHNMSDLATAIAVDNAGGVFVTGTSSGNSSSDYATVSYQAISGEEVWVQRYNTSVNSFERAAAIAVDDTGGVYVTGYSSSDGSLEASEYATVRYNATTGEQIWAEHYAESADNVDVAVDIAVDGMGNVIVTGYSNSEFNYDFLTIKYRQQDNKCPVTADAAITGSTTIEAGTTGSVYYLSDVAPLFSYWSITDSNGNPYTNFTGQGSPTISTNWPSEPDLFKISLTYVTVEGCTINTSPVYVHVFDPDAGFVTGGGWVDSPANSAYEFMQSSRRAHFSLVARFNKRNENQVQGSTMLILQAGSFTFRSTSYDAGSLVITNNRAYFSGRGIVTHRNGPGRPAPDARQYGFMVSATDEDFGASSGADKFRLMIWEVNADGTQGAVIYDNQAGCSPANLDHNAEACTAIGGGNITIHKPKMKSMAKKDVLSAGAASGEQELMVYPTSIQDRATITFSLESTGNYTLEVYDLKGALVKRIAAGAAEAGKRYEHTLFVEGMSRGLYLARLSTMEKVQTVKLVVQR